jgi:hypothetical protein
MGELTEQKCKVQTGSNHGLQDSNVCTALLWGTAERRMACLDSLFSGVLM